MIVLGFAGFFNDFVMPAAWAGTMDIGGRYSGTVSGAMNMMLVRTARAASAMPLIGFSWTISSTFSGRVGDLARARRRP